jgi:drug/metabolite transporter (DMT)-like permease
MNTLMKYSTLSPAQLGFLAVAFSSLLFSTKGVLIKMSFACGVEPVVMMALRMLFALPFFLGLAVFEILQVKKRHGRALTVRDWLILSALGLLGYYLAALFDMIGLQYVSAGMERIILYINPTFVVLISVLIFRQKLDRKILLPFFMCYGGVALACYGDLSMNRENGMFGVFMIIMCALFFAFFLIGYGKLVHRIGPNRLTAYGMLVSSAVVLAHFSIEHPVSSLQVPGKVYIITGIMAVFATFMPMYLMSYGLKLISPSRVSVVFGIGTVSTLFLGWVLLNETLTPVQVCGMAVVLFGGLWMGMEKT